MNFFKNLKFLLQVLDHQTEKVALNPQPSQNF